MEVTHQKRRTFVVLVALTFFAVLVLVNVPRSVNTETKPSLENTSSVNSPAIDALKTLQIKGRAPKTDYARDKFGADWSSTEGCDTRNIILNRDLENVMVGDSCSVISGTLNDPYTGKIISFVRGKTTSGDVQIDHVVALSDAWQKGAQQFTQAQRVKLANDPLELLAVDGKANMEKSGSDAASWLPPNKPFRCQYVARQVAVKQKYGLWVTQPEYDAINNILQNCPNQMLPSP